MMLVGGWGKPGDEPLPRERGPGRGRQSRRSGVVIPMVVVGAIALLACAGLTIDIGLLCIGCQQCQTVADAAALAGAQELPYAQRATAHAAAFAVSNIRQAEAEAFAVTTTVYQRDEEVPGVGPAPYGGAVVVTVRKQVPFHFLRAVGFQSGTARRRAVSSKLIGGTCVCPIWIWEDTPVEYGLLVNLLMADAPHTGVPGNFGFLEPAGGVDIKDALKGLLTPEEEELQRTYEGDYIYGNTGLSVGIFRQCLKTDNDSRLRRGTSPPYDQDTFENFHSDNPRILIVPFVRYIDGSGSNARFLVLKFGAFWLEDVITQGNRREIVGRFIDFTRPGGTGYNEKETHLIG